LRKGKQQGAGKCGEDENLKGKLGKYDKKID
jgi:hypothetical protein